MLFLVSFHDNGGLLHTGMSRRSVSRGYENATSQIAVLPRQRSLRSLSAALPRQVAPMAELDRRSFAAYRAALQRTRGFAFPEAELRAGFAVNPDGSMGR